MDDLHLSAEEVSALHTTAENIVNAHAVKTLYPIAKPDDLTRAILAALIVCVAAQRERDAKVVEAWFPTGRASDLDAIAAAIRDQSSRGG